MVMRGDDNKWDFIFSYISPEKRIPVDHPLRPVKAFADDILKEISKTFEKMYSHAGRPSIPPERLLKSMILRLYIQSAPTVCSARRSITPHSILY